jgi:chromosome segregation ATPase
MNVTVVREGLENALKSILQDVNNGSKDLQELAKEIAATAVQVAALTAESGDLSQTKLYRELLAQTLLLAEIARVRLSKEIMARVQAAIQTGSQILITALTQI